VADPWRTDQDCDQPPTTCRAVVNFRPDAALRLHATGMLMQGTRKVIDRDTFTFRR
jgi:hypothetical protein